MIPQDADHLTELLIAANRGDHDARQKLWHVVYNLLRNLARVRLRNEHAGHSLSTTALVHEVYLQLDLVTEKINTTDRNHFFALACKIMRQVLIEKARKRAAQKRKGQKVSLDFELPDRSLKTPKEDLLALDLALQNLEKKDSKLGQVVECKFFGGLTTHETAEVLGVSERTIERYWIRAKTYLYRALHQQID